MCAWVAAGNRSEVAVVECGLAQDSVLGPFLFRLLILPHFVHRLMLSYMQMTLFLLLFIYYYLLLLECLVLYV